MREATRDDDDATRQVIADALTERGDPRGELIALDLRLKADGSRGPLLERARELRSLHLAHLLGPLAPLVQDATWDRGYAEHVVLAVKHDPDLVAATGSPLWRTVRSIDVVRHHRRHDAHLTRLLAHDVLFGLRSLRGHLPDSLLVQLARGPARPLETLVCGRGSLGPHQDDAVTRELFDGPGLAGLRTLAFDEPLEDGATLAWIGETPVGAGLTSLDVSAPFEDLPAWMHAFVGPLAHLDRLRIGSMLGTNVWVLERGGARPHLTAQVRLALLTVWRRAIRSDLAVAEVLDTLPAGSLDRVDVQIGGGHRATRSSGQALDDAIQRVTR